MITDTSYFIGEIYLPQVGSDASIIANNNSYMEGIIDECEVDLMDSFWGRQLSLEFFGQLTDGALNPTGVDQKWINFFNGVEYEKNGIKYYWRGLTEVKGAVKKSLFSYYAYCKAIQEGVKQHTTLGIVKADAENSNNASAIDKYTAAYRNLIEWYGGTNECKVNYGEHYYRKGILVHDYYTGHQNSTRDVSMYQYVLDHKDDFENWSFNPIAIENQNTWGI